MIERIGIAGYRSVRSLILSLGQVNVVTGPNGSGKSNVYRALRLLSETAQGRLGESIAREGGFDSIRWAGPKHNKKDPVGLRLGFAGLPHSYCLDLGLPIPASSAFDHDPEMKRECLWRGAMMEAKFLCADRRKTSLRCRLEKGAWQQVDLPLSRYGSMLTEYSDPFNAPELIVAREAMASWRFYDTFRVDVRAPARLASIGSFTPVLSGDGRDLAAALQTIREIGDHRGLDEVIDCAFPGSQVRVERRDAKMQLTLTQPGMLRNLSAAELSDGTLRFLLLTAALLTPRPPELLVLNEPENSLHPDLMPALAGLIRMAAAYSQIIVVSHNQALIDDLESSDECVSIRLNKENGATVIKDGDLLSRFGWKWPAR